MKIAEVLNEGAVSCQLRAREKAGVIRELVALLVDVGEVNARDVEALSKILLDRESLGSTGIGQGVAIPHGKSPLIRNLIAAFGVSKDGIDFGSLDGEPAHLFFLLMAPEDSAGPHLKALARISRLLKDRAFRESLRQAIDQNTLVNLIREEDRKRQ